MTEINVFAPAKINLFLEVTSRRQDGYHNLATLFAKLAFGDDIKISAERAPNTQIELKIKGPFGAGLPADNTNLAHRAAAAFLEHFGIKARVNIRVQKNIPLGAGLGGGSSDAAAVINGMCNIFGVQKNAKRMKDLVQIGARLGADVPVFLYPGTFLKAGGIGDELTPVKNNITSPFVVLAWPGVHSSTPEAYKNLILNNDKKILTNLANLNILVTRIEQGSPFKDWTNLLYNKLEDAVLPRLSAVARLKEELLVLGARDAIMSGSGSCVLALVENKLKGEEMVRTLNGRGNIAAFLTHFLRTKTYENNRDTDTSYGGRAA